MAIRVRELLAMTPDGVLEKIGQEVCVDKVNQKLTGSIMYKLMLYTLVKTTRTSLRVMESIYASPMFQKMIGFSDTEPRHSSFADRLSKINPDYFAAIFEYLVDTYNTQFSKKESRTIYRFDSTLIGLSTRLFTQGIDCGGHTRSHFKMSIGQRGVIPSIVRFCSSSEEISENIALRRVIREATLKKEDIVVFDRGLASGKTFVEFSQENITFVTRVDVGRRHKIIETLKEFTAASKFTTRTIVILSDQKVQILDSATEKFFKNPFRLVKTKSLETSTELWFLTNDFICSAEDITEIYKRRWDIEVFFRFIKQELNFKHFLARNMNGLKSHIYMALIVAILFLIYKTSNNKTGYKIPKMQFVQEIENEVIADLIYFSGGDPDIFRRKFCPESIIV